MNIVFVNVQNVFVNDGVVQKKKRTMDEQLNRKEKTKKKKERYNFFLFLLK